MNPTAPSGGGAIPRRLLVVGDSAVGKSRFIATFLQSCRCTSPSSDVVETGTESFSSTIGFRCSAAVWRSAGRDVTRGATAAYSSQISATHVIEFVDMGGNRVFDCAGRLPCYQLAVDGVLLVYSRENHQSAVSLLVWYEELVHAGLLGSSPAAKPFLIIETVLSAESSDVSRADTLMQRQKPRTDFFSRSFDAMKRWARQSSDRHHALRVAISTVTFFVRFVHRAIIFVMTVVLFGPNHAAVQWTPPSAARALDTLHGESMCRGEIRGCPMYSSSTDEFEREAMGDFLHFVSCL